MILVVNCIVGERPIAWFDGRVVPRLAGMTERPIRVVHLTDRTYPDAGPFSHLLLSGSELSAAEQNDRDEDLLRLIRDFLERRRAVLGICYGHQMVARTILGDGACRRAAVPEFGWGAVEIRENPLFAGLANPVSLHSHYDEVCGLTDDFRVIASTRACAVQGFQYRDRPVWGVQFHPEVSFREGRGMNREILEKDPTVEPYMLDELPDPKALLQNGKIFRNFFRAGE